MSFSVAVGSDEPTLAVQKDARAMYLEQVKWPGIGLE